MKTGSVCYQQPKIMHKCLLIVVSLSVALAEICPDKWALNNVSAWIGGPSPYAKSHFEKSINFNTLDNAAVIHVVSANVSVLCEGMIKDFRRLHLLALTNANISKIQPEAFKQLPKLTSLSLAINRLTSIDEGVFKNLEGLTTLYLSANQIDTISAKAFADLAELKKIFLDRNNIAEIGGEWFLNNRKLALINLAFNSISLVQSEAFKLPENGQVEIRLQHNLIENVKDKAVVATGAHENVPYLTLFLNHNRLKSVSSEFIASMNDQLYTTVYFDNNSVTCVPTDVLYMLKETTVRFYLRNNPLTCDCVKSITDFLQNHELGSALFDYNFPNECYLYGLPTPREWDERRFY